MHQVRTRAAPLLASLFAGPVFLAAAGAAELYLRLPATITITEADFVGFVTMLVPAFFVGFILSFLPNMVGTLAMAWAAQRSELARWPFAWLAAGAAAGALIAAAVGLNPEASATFGLVFTSAMCAGLCRSFVSVD